MNLQVLPWPTTRGNVPQSEMTIPAAGCCALGHHESF